MFTWIDALRTRCSTWKFSNVKDFTTGFFAGIVSDAEALKNRSRSAASPSEMQSIMRTPPLWSTVNALVVVRAEYTRHCSRTVLLLWLLVTVAPGQSPVRTTMPCSAGAVTSTFSIRVIKQKRRSIAASVWLRNRQLEMMLPRLAFRSTPLRPPSTAAKSFITKRLPMRLSASFWSVIFRVNPLELGPSLKVAPLPSMISRVASGRTMSPSEL